MALTLYAHPFSSYCQKVLVALYEHETTFAYLKLDEPGVHAALTTLWPLWALPCPCRRRHCRLREQHHYRTPGSAPSGRMRLVPARPHGRRPTVRFLDRFFDTYVHTPVQKIVGNALRSADQRDDKGVDEARAMLDKAYGMARNAGRRHVDRRRLQPCRLRRSPGSFLRGLGAPGRALITRAFGPTGPGSTPGRPWRARSTRHDRTGRCFHWVPLTGIER